MTITTTVKERPILFSGPMVRSILNRSKTQTRRIVKHDIRVCPLELKTNKLFYPDELPLGIRERTERWLIDTYCPYGAVGDRLWVRETWAEHPDGGENEGYVYRATDLGWDDEDTGLKWKPSIFMSRQASRLTLEITDIRVERLQGIKEEDAIAEGVDRVIATRERFGCRAAGMLLYQDYSDTRSPWRRGYESPVESFRTLWDSINAKTHPWDSNPWIWAVSFKRIAD